MQSQKAIIYEFWNGTATYSKIAPLLRHANQVGAAFLATAPEGWDYDIVLNRWDDAFPDISEVDDRLIGSLAMNGYTGDANINDNILGGLSRAFAEWLRDQDYAVVLFSYSLGVYHKRFLAEIPYQGKLLVLPYHGNSGTFIQDFWGENFAAFIQVGGGVEENIRDYGRGIDCFDVVTGVPEFDSNEVTQVSLTAPYIAGKLAHLTTDHSPIAIKQMLWEQLPDYPVWDVKNGFGKMPESTNETNQNTPLPLLNTFVFTQNNQLTIAFAAPEPTYECEVRVNGHVWKTLSTQNPPNRIGGYRRVMPEELTARYRFTQGVDFTFGGEATITLNPIPHEF